MTTPATLIAGNRGTGERGNRDAHSNRDKNYYFIYISKYMTASPCARERVCERHPFPGSPLPRYHAPAPLLTVIPGGDTA